MRERLLVDWPLKLLALLLAFGLWVSIIGQDGTLRDVVVPLEVNFGQERIAAIPPPTTVTVRLEGPQRTLRRLDALTLAVRLDMRDAAPGEREVSLLRSHLTGVPRGVDVALFDPDRLRLVVARRAERELDVVPEFLGSPSAGHALYGFVVQPARVSVEGPQEDVDALRRLHTEPIPLEGRSAPFVARVGLRPEHPGVRVMDAERVRVEVLVESAPVEAVLEALPVEVGGGGAAQVSPSAVRVTLDGPAWLLERLDPARIAAIAEVPAGTRPGARVPVRVEPRLGDDEARLIRVRSIRPAEVAVRPPGPPRPGG
jgi:hypothetical protein